MTPRFQHFRRDPDLPGHRDARIIVYNLSPHGGLTCFRNKVLSGYRDYLKRCHKSTALQCYEASTDVLLRYRPGCNFHQCRLPAKDCDLLTVFGSPPPSKRLACSSRQAAGNPQCGRCFQPRRGALTQPRPEVESMRARPPSSSATCEMEVREHLLKRQGVQ